MVWKSIPSFEGYYEVSDTGLVRSLDRWIYPKTGTKRYIVYSRVLCQNPNTKRYFRVGLYKEGAGKTREVHKLVALSFLGDCPEGMEVRHLDGSRTNNKLSNLVYGTLSQNQQDRFQHGTACVGQKHNLCALTDTQVKSIAHDYSTGQFTMQQLADKFGVKPTTIWRIVNGHRRLTNGKKIRVKNRNFSRSGTRRTEEKQD